MVRVSLCPSFLPLASAHSRMFGHVYTTNTSSYMFSSNLRDMHTGYASLVKCSSLTTKTVTIPTVCLPLYTCRCRESALKGERANWGWTVCIGCSCMPGWECFGSLPSLAMDPDVSVKSMVPVCVCYGYGVQGEYWMVWYVGEGGGTL